MCCSHLFPPSVVVTCTKVQCFPVSYVTYKHPNTHQLAIYMFLIIYVCVCISATLDRSES